MKKNLLLSIVATLAFTNMFAQENSVFYQQSGTSRLYTTDEYLNGKIVDSIRLSNEPFESVDSIIKTVNRGNEKVIVYDRSLKHTGKNEGIVMRVVHDENIYSMIDKPLPNFKIKDINGTTYTLDSLKGKPTLINFWFHTCGPCKAEMPVLNQIKKLYGDKVNFIALTFDPKELIQPILDTRPFNFIQLIDAKDYVDKLSMHAAPKNIFIDKNGIIRQVYEGVDLTYNETRTTVMLSNGQAIIDMLNKLLKE
ncbi:MAG: TlpA disulfide reductase family protein [Arachidicoccus sp.]|nr:TlpA disulfide reductase family protein [Arachidicoccus sp.]